MERVQTRFCVNTDLQCDKFLSVTLAVGPRAPQWTNPALMNLPNF